MRQGGMHIKNLALQKSIKWHVGEGITLQCSRLHRATWMWGANIYKHFFVSLSTKQRAKNLLGKRAGILKAMNMTARLVWEDVLWGCYGRSCVVNKSLPNVSSCGGTWYYSEWSFQVSFFRHASGLSDDPPWYLLCFYCSFCMFAASFEWLLYCHDINRVISVPSNYYKARR